jgi:hypothetical protein
LSAANAALGAVSTFIAMALALFSFIVRLLSTLARKPQRICAQGWSGPAF